jgi:hypothetical protein
VSNTGVIEVSAISFGSLFAVIVPIFLDKLSGTHSEVFTFILQFSRVSISIFLNHSLDHILVWFGFAQLISKKSSIHSAFTI